MKIKVDVLIRHKTCYCFVKINNMRRSLILSTFCFVFMISKSQMDFSVSGIYSSPLDQFCINDYNEGWGAKFGLGYTFLTDQNWGIEVGGNWLISNNGWRKATLDFGDYTLRNNFYNWQIKGNIVFEQGLFKHYFGANIGRARYFTTEYLGFNATQEDGSTYFDDVLYKQRVFQFGAQFGTYIRINDIVSFDLGMSVLKSPETVKYINFESYSFDGETINYEEPSTSPFILTISAGIRINLSEFEISEPSCGNGYSSNSSYNEYDYSEPRCKRSSPSSSRRSSWYSNRSSSSSSSGSSSSSSSSSKKSTPKLYKNGKTPIKYE